MKPSVLQASLFGDNHHDAIDAQVEVLSGRIKESEFDDMLDNEQWKHNERDAANEANDWMLGLNEESPSKGWISLVRK